MSDIPHHQILIAGLWRDGGLGREKGHAGIRQYMEQKSLYWGTNDAPLPWAT